MILVMICFFKLILRQVFLKHVLYNLISIKYILFSFLLFSFLFFLVFLQRQREPTNFYRAIDFRRQSIVQRRSIPVERPAPIRNRRSTVQPIVQQQQIVPLRIESRRATLNVIQENVVRVGNLYLNIQIVDPPLVEEAVENIIEVTHGTEEHDENIEPVLNNSVEENIIALLNNNSYLPNISMNEDLILDEIM